MAPASDAERGVAAVWGELFGIEGLGVHDDFFELGGHSLLATQLLSRLRERFGRDLRLEAFFSGPTIAELAARLEQAGSGESPGRPTVPALVPGAGGTEAPLSFAQQRLWALDRMEPDPAVYNLPLGLRMAGPVRPWALAAALSEIVRRHEALRTTFKTVRGEPLQVVRPAPPVPVPVADLSALAEPHRGTAVARLGPAAAARPIRLEQEPMLRALLLRLDPGFHELHLVVHHIAIDGWGWGVLLEELATLYEAFSAGRPSPLAPLAVQYADFAAWQRAVLSPERLAEEVGWWRERLAGAPPVKLPADRPRPSARSGRGASFSRPLAEASLPALRALAREEDSTLFMTSLAAFLVLLHSMSGQEDLVVGTDVANRTRRELEPLIGFFVNQLVLRTELAGDPSFRELLHRVRKVTLEAYDHQDAPFDRVVEALGAGVDRSRTPLFQAKLVLQNTPAPRRAASGVDLALVAVHNGTAKFDLLLDLSEEPDHFLATLELATDLFDERTATRLLDRFDAVLELATAEPDAPLSALGERLARREDEARQARAQGARQAGLERARRQPARRREAVTAATTTIDNEQGES